MWRCVMDSIISEIANVGLTILFFLIAVGTINWLRCGKWWISIMQNYMLNYITFGIMLHILKCIGID